MSQNNNGGRILMPLRNAPPPAKRTRDTSTDDDGDSKRAKCEADTQTDNMVTLFPPENVVTCCMCHDVLFQPITLTCGHNICIRHVKYNISDKRLDRCPHCRETVMGVASLFRVNKDLDELVRSNFPALYQEKAAEWEKTEPHLKRYSLYQRSRFRRIRVAALSLLRHSYYSHDELLDAINEDENIRRELFSLAKGPPVSHDEMYHVLSRSNVCVSQNFVMWQRQEADHFQFIEKIMQCAIHTMKRNRIELDGDTVEREIMARSEERARIRHNSLQQQQQQQQQHNDDSNYPIGPSLHEIQEMIEDDHIIDSGYLMRHRNVFYNYIGEMNYLYFSWIQREVNMFPSTDIGEDFLQQNLFPITSYSDSECLWTTLEKMEGHFGKEVSNKTMDSYARLYQQPLGDDDEDDGDDDDGSSYNDIEEQHQETSLRTIRNNIESTLRRANQDTAERFTIPALSLPSLAAQPSGIGRRYSNVGIIPPVSTLRRQDASANLTMYGREEDTTIPSAVGSSSLNSREFAVPRRALLNIETFSNGAAAAAADQSHDANSILHVFQGGGGDDHLENPAQRIRDQSDREINAIRNSIERTDISQSSGIDYHNNRIQQDRTYNWDQDQDTNNEE